ncbi:MAG: hypothetical protein K0U59_11565 [Gammaproteobacteria bacterium]|nr:hypothetical protein [Gammaproteobacteria bacterium]
MSTFWVVDTKAKIAPESTYEQDGSKWYYGRSIVPADSIEEALTLLRAALKNKHVVIESVLSIIDYNHSTWDSEKDELHETIETYEKAKAHNEVVTGSFASGMYLDKE